MFTWLGGEWARRFPKHHMVGLAATIIFYIPILREIFLWSGYRDAGRHVAQRALKHGHSLYICTGGEAESLATVQGSQRGTLRCVLAWPQQSVHVRTASPVASFVVLIGACAVVCCLTRQRRRCPAQSPRLRSFGAVLRRGFDTDVRLWGDGHVHNVAVVQGLPQLAVKDVSDCATAVLWPVVHHDAVPVKGGLLPAVTQLLGV